MQYAQLSAQKKNTLMALYRTGCFVELETQANALLKTFPDEALLWKLLAAALQQQGKPALPALHKLVELMPGDAEAHNNLGNALLEDGQLDEAAESYAAALQINPNFVEAHYNLGNVMCEAHHNEAAVICYRNALTLQPAFIPALNNLGATLQELGQLDEALACCRQTLALDPASAMAHSSLLGLLSQMAITPSTYLDEARRYGQRVARSVTAKFTAWRCVGSPQRLRVGVVSGNLNSHPVGYFLEGLLQQLDRARVELYAYPSSPHCDELTARIQPFFTAWRPIDDLDDAAAARLIHNDGVHLLLDLSGHTERNRLPVFAWKPAPVQATWLGYWASTGVAEMDYLLADETGVPAAQRGNFTEAICYLPDTRLCFSPPETRLPVAPLPALRNGYLTFGCFQNFAKVSDDVLALWGKILGALPDAKLRWQCKQFGEQAVIEKQTQRLQQHGIAPTRLMLHGATSRHDYLAAHAHVDVILDTLHYPGGTTTCEALWMGVPTLTLAGDTLLSRQGASLLAAAGLKQWMAHSPEEYVARAVALAAELPHLAELRFDLREQVAQSPLFNATLFAQRLVDVFWQMWRERGIEAGGK
jgi:predicted O-linked N-acetylglucosamine transferase (SPINDLY family)